ncbi:hypothetical protein LguiA_028308 [Lonicera macranthoides]
MDIWSFAAAAGAGLAQHWKGLTRGGQSISELSNKIQPESSPLVEQPLDQKGPFCRLVQRKNLSGNVSKERESVPQGVLTEEVASTSEFLSNGDLQDCEGVRVSGYGDLLLKPSNVQPGSPYCSMRNRCNARSKRINGRFVKPLNSLESCLMAQLYKENAEMEEYSFDKVPSLSMPIVRPLLVTDGSRIISRASGDFFSVSAQNGDNKMQNENYLEENKTIFGIPPLPKVGSLDIPRKTKVPTRKERGGRISNMSKIVGGKHSLSQGGSSSGALLFCLGVSVGVISSFLANNREVDKLNELLKQTENLVQDLQEELEMKDSLTVKELPIEDYESQDTHGDPCSTEAPQAFSLVQSLDESIKSDHKEINDRKEEEEESLSKIEAELEAELERLELSMNSSSLEHKLSDLVELDLDFAPDIVHGELRADMFGKQTGAQPYADRDGSGSSTTHSANYAVSPRELSVRLHEVLQSRLEERVMELETALQNSNRKVQYMKSDHSNKRWREFSNRDSTAPSVQESPDEEDYFSNEPVVINLSGEALDAYNEAYDEFANMNESDNEDLEENQESLGTFEQYLNDHSISNGKASTTKREDHEGYTGMSEDESGGGDDEMEKLLIKQILEKARKGSPVVLNAQRVLCLMEQDDQH